MRVLKLMGGNEAKNKKWTSKNRSLAKKKKIIKIKIKKHTMTVFFKKPSWNL